MNSATYLADWQVIVLGVAILVAIFVVFLAFTIAWTIIADKRREKRMKEAEERWNLFG